VDSAIRLSASRRGATLEVSFGAASDKTVARSWRRSPGATAAPGC